MNDPALSSAPQKKNGLHALLELFTEHPRSVGESYGEHLFFTIKIAFYLILTAICAVLHGLFPKILQTTTSDRIIALADDIQRRRAAWAAMKQAPPGQ